MKPSCQPAVTAVGPGDAGACAPASCAVAPATTIPAARTFNHCITHLLRDSPSTRRRRAIEAATRAKKKAREAGPSRAFELVRACPMSDYVITWAGMQRED